MPWAVAIALGAIVAPPDAAAAGAVLRQVGTPQRLLVILEGESLFNDATALLVYRLAIGAMLARVLSPATVIPLLLVVTVGSVALGLVLSRLLIPVISRVHDPAMAVVVQFCGTFAVWILADALRLSGILTMVVFAMAASRRAANLTPARVRIPSYAVWDFAVFVLNVLAFILIGFQLKAILGRIDASTLARYVIIGGAVCLATIAARIAWVVYALVRRKWTLTVGEASLVGWCGMRGIVTLAAALALPTTVPGGAPFPYRDLVLFTAFSVVLGTLVVQGMTVRPLMKWAAIVDDGAVEREVRLARVETLRAALSATARTSLAEISQLLRARYEVMLRRALAAVDSDGEVSCSRDGATLCEDSETVRLAITAERHRLIALRTDGTIGDPAFQRLEQELDWEELHLRQLAPE
jgi:CPA1 family monovalent cation:H+ antiporter